MKLVRHSSNPLLKAHPTRVWDGGLVFNACVARTDDGTVHMLYRAARKGFKRYDDGRGHDMYTDYVSAIGHAVSNDGIAFIADPSPVISPDAEFDIWGAEDPRITQIEDTFYILYTGLTGPAYTGTDHIRVCLATTNDFKNYQKHGVVGPPLSSKAGCLLPEKLGDKYWLMYTDFTSEEKSSSYAAPFDSLQQLMNPPEDFWPQRLNMVANYPTLASGRTITNGPSTASDFEMGAGLIKTEFGWLFVHSRIHLNIVPRRWTVGAAMLALDDLNKVTHEIPYDLLEPETADEVDGAVKNVVFPQGHDVVGDEYRLYYGAGDQAVCLATCSLTELVDELLKYPVGK